ncbi:MAG: hypothetical protein ACJAW3_000128 [Lentimonas sp.]
MLINGKNLDIVQYFPIVAPTFCPIPASGFKDDFGQSGKSRPLENLKNLKFSFLFFLDFFQVSVAIFSALN